MTPNDDTTARLAGLEARIAKTESDHWWYQHLCVYYPFDAEVVGYKYQLYRELRRLEAERRALLDAVAWEDDDAVQTGAD